MTENDAYALLDEVDTDYYNTDDGDFSSDDTDADPTFTPIYNKYNNEVKMKKQSKVAST